MEKSEVIKSLEKAKQFKSHIIIGNKILSIDQLIQEVMNETEIGKKYVELMCKYAQK